MTSAELDNNELCGSGLPRILDENPAGHSVADVAPALATNDPAGAGVHGAYPDAE